MDLWWFYDFNPLPITLEHMSPEKLQAISINFDGAPGMAIHQLSKIGFQLLPN